LLYGVALLAFMYGLSILPDTTGIVLILAGITGIVFFVRIERRKKYPVFNMNLFFKNRQFMASSFTAMINYSATFGVAFLMSLYLQYIKGMSPQEAGQVLALQPIVMALFSPVSGHLSDRFDSGFIATLGLVVLTAGLVFFVAIDENTSILFIGIVLAVFGLGYAFFSSPNTNAIMSSVEKKYYGLASGTVGTMRLTGQLISMGVVMLIFSLLIGKVEIQPGNYPEFLTSAKLSFFIFAVFGLLGVILSASRIKKQNRKILGRNL
jgi:MFS family permease